MRLGYYHKVKRFCERYRLFQKGDKVAVGFSGGSDSVYLVLALLQLSREQELELSLIHVHHGIRGEEADRDLAFCQKFAREKGLSVQIFQGNVPEMAKQQKCSLEEMARKYRYDCFRQVVEEQEVDKIAVAHHQDDQAETILFQMLRGSGLRGMGGMKGITGNLVRPLLHLRHEEIKQALEEVGQDWCEDSTNRDVAYSRNRLRHQIIPLLEQQVNAAATEHIARCSEQFQWIQDFLEEELDKRQGSLKLHRTDSGRVEVSVQGFLALPRALQMEMAHRLLVDQAQQNRNITAAHITALLSLAEGESGKEMDFPYGIKGGKEYDILWLEKSSALSVPRQDPPSAFCWEINPREPFDITIPAMGAGTVSITFSRQKCQEGYTFSPGKIPKNICTKWFDYATINGTLELRHPKTGDFLWLDERRTKRKSLSRWMIDSHIPRRQRERLWVLAEGCSVLWIPELGRQSAAYYVSSDTREILCATFTVSGE